MSLISILLFTVALLTFFAGLSLYLGAAKPDRSRMVWFMGIGVAAAIWEISIALFRNLTVEYSEMLVPIVAGIYIGGAMLAVVVLGFGAWKYAWGKLLVVISTVFYAVMLALVLQDHSIFFAGSELTTNGNAMLLVNGWAYWLYVAFLILDNVVAWLAMLYHARHARLKRLKISDYVLVVGFGISGIFACLFDAVLPMFRYDLIWVGPLACSVAVIATYYVMLKYRAVSINSRWLRVASIVVLTATGVAAYMLIFYLIFTALFKIPNPSASVLVLNFLMIVIVLLLMPVINELSASIRSMISVGQVDIGYVIKKLNHLAAKNVDLRDLAGFLADHLHFAYIGFVINGHLYGSKALSLTPVELAQITHLKQNAREMWQEPSKEVAKTFDELGLRAVAELRNAKGKTFGQMLVGKPLGKGTFERRDLIQLEMIINLVATVIDSQKHLRA